MNICLVAFALTLGCINGGAPAPTTADRVEAVPPAEPTTPASPAVPAEPRTTPAPLDPAAPTEDRWLAEDKLQHFALSFAATQMGYGGARFALDREPAVAVAATVAVGLGLAKEVRDVRAGGPFSLKDLAWDAAGVALGVLFVRRVR